MKHLLLAATLWLSACATTTPYVVRPTCPAKPVLPMVMETELQALDNSAYERLVERELRLRAYIYLLEINCEGE